MIVISKSTPSFSKTAAAWAITGISESLPITMPTLAIAHISFSFIIKCPFIH